MASTNAEREERAMKIKTNVKAGKPDGSPLITNPKRRK